MYVPAVLKMLAAGSPPSAGEGGHCQPPKPRSLNETRASIPEHRFRSEEGWGRGGASSKESQVIL